MEMPTEAEFTAVFGTEPDRKDREIDFLFDTSIFRFENKGETFEVILSPFYNEFTLLVTGKKEQEIIGHLKLRSVEKIEIVQAPQEPVLIRIFHGRSDSYVHTLAFTFQPRFQMALQEHYL